ncbi:rhomboid family intramembrane serine protease [Halogeometricum sp. S1BR25-6]|uniref:Rhomboid family intramembrane serine protease n=1 Tax=Halogeometricum salsisoli TaxID=2950536 RepID=A0ABU2GDD0_9EURY|nr:rhomboid family intramembrane serine protease [Halogeometricum sp. S1BR25-6]MDS0298797.1 rhomboid family intramembrane serine protease [Halogeometricum sp. S1BR25-6]
MDVSGWLVVQRAGVVVAFVLAAAAVVAADRPSGRWGAALRRRFVLGVPWGSLLTLLGVLAVYLFVQGGLSHWYNPLTIPFRAWSYFYPLGVVTAGFAHSGPGHLLGNLVGAAAFAPIAEYAWGHFPRERGATSFGSWRTNPYVRAFVVFPAVVFVVGVCTAAFAIGPIIGFSGVVFAFAGFALVNYPFGTVVALAVGSVVRTVYAAMQTPQLTAGGRPAYITPWWADIAIQGHAFGLFVGVLLGAALVRTRPKDARPSALRLWTATVVFGVQQSLWAVYWYRGGDTYVLYRAVGVGLVAVMAVVVTYTVVGSDRPVLEGVFEGAFAHRRWQAGAACLLLVTGAMTGPAVVANLYTAGDDELPGEEVVVRDYEVTYAEGVTNGMTAAVDVSAFGETTAVNTSGVVVRSEERGIWTTAVTKGRLAFGGRAAVVVGGVGWRETVHAVRDGWVTTGGNTTYRVLLVRDGSARVAYTADPARAGPVVGGRNISVEAAPQGYYLRVNRENETVAARLPQTNQSVTLDGLTFTREKRKLFVEYGENGETRLQIAKRETYK